MKKLLLLLAILTIMGCGVLIASNHRGYKTEKKLEPIAIVNDVDAEIKPEYIQALKYKGTKLIPWSKRQTSPYFSA